MAVYDQDQQTALPMMIGGVTSLATPAVLKAAAPANSVYIFLAGYSYHWGSGPLAFRRGCSYALDPRLKAALLAAGAPMAAA